MYSARAGIDSRTVLPSRSVASGGGQAETAAGSTRTVDAVEALEDVAAVLGRDARPLVRHHQRRPLRTHQHTCPGRGVLEGVLDQRAPDPEDPLLVAESRCLACLL